MEFDLISLSILIWAIMTVLFVMVSIGFTIRENSLESHIQELEEQLKENTRC